MGWLLLCKSYWVIVRKVGGNMVADCVPPNSNAPLSHVPSEPRVTPSGSVLYGAVSAVPVAVAVFR